MKKTYMIPQMEIVDEDVKTQLLEGSISIEIDGEGNAENAEARELFEIDF